LLTNSGYSSAW